MFALSITTLRLTHNFYLLWKLIIYVFDKFEHKIFCGNHALKFDISLLHLTFKTSIDRSDKVTAVSSAYNEKQILRSNRLRSLKNKQNNTVPITEPFGTPGSPL